MGRGTAAAEAGSNNNLSSPASPGPVQEGQTGGQALGIPLPPHSPSTCPRRSGPGLQPKEDRSPIRGVCLILIVRFSRNHAMPSIRTIVTRYRGIAGLGMGRPPTARTSENANSTTFVFLHRICFLSRARRIGRVLEKHSGIDQSGERIVVEIFVT